MRKGRDREKNEVGERGQKEKNDENSGHYVIASSRPPERCTLVPIIESIYLFSLTHLGDGLASLKTHLRLYLPPHFLFGVCRCVGS